MANPLEDEAAAGGGLLDDETPNQAAGLDQTEGVETVDFDQDEIYRRPGELSICSEKTQGIKHRFSVLPDPANPNAAYLRRSWVHYVQGKGYAKCHSKRDAQGKFIGKPAFCCAQQASEPRFAALVVEYTCTDAKSARFPEGLGSPEKPFTFEIKALMLSRVAAEQLKNKAGENDEGTGLKVQQVDYYYTPANGKKGLEFERIGPKATYTKNAGIKAQVEAAAAQFADGKELARRLGRVLNVNQMRDHLGMSGGSTNAGSGGEFGDL